MTVSKKGFDKYEWCFFDDFVFNASANGFGYLRTDTTYANTITDVTTLLGLINTIPLNTTAAPDYYSGVFTVPTTGNNLYLVYDYRDTTAPTPTPPTPPECHKAEHLSCAGDASGFPVSSSICYGTRCHFV